MPKIKVNDVHLYYETYGQGEPVVLVAGYASDHTAWTIILEVFAKQYQVIVFDNRGVGQSDAPDMPYTIDMFADDTIALCDALKIVPAHFIGNSMGGKIVQSIAHRYPTYVKSVILVNSYTKIDIRFMLHAKAQIAYYEAGNKMETLTMSALPWAFSSEFLNQPGMVDTLIGLFLNSPFPITLNALRNQFNALLDFDSLAWLNKIKAPCLVIGSDQDQIVAESHLQDMANRIPQAKYYCFKGVGHLPFIEKPAEFTQVVKDFLGDIRG